MADSNIILRILENKYYDSNSNYVTGIPIWELEVSNNQNTFLGLIDGTLPSTSNTNSSKLEQQNVTYIGSTDPENNPSPLSLNILSNYDPNENNAWICYYASNIANNDNPYYSTDSGATRTRFTRTTAMIGEEINEMNGNYQTINPMLNNLVFTLNNSNDTIFLYINEICFPPFTLVETDTGLRQISDLKRGDLVKTQKGLIPLTKNLITHTPLGAKYVKFPKSFFAENVPERDLYMTSFHAFSLGLKEGTEDVWNWLEAKEFLGNMEGIEEVKLETKTYHNLIFYDMEEFSAEGMKVYSHHPNGNPYKLQERENLNEVNKEERKLNIMTWDDFIKKPDDVELKKFIADKLKF